MTVLDFNESIFLIEILTKSYDFYKRAGMTRKTLYIAYRIAVEYSISNRNDLALLYSTLIDLLDLMSEYRKASRRTHGKLLFTLFAKVP